VKADDASVSVSSENYGHLRFASNAFTTSGARENVTIGVTVWIDKKRGAASTNEVDDESLKATVALAEQLARISPVDREYMPTLSKQTYKPVNGYAEATSSIAAAARAKTINDVITACEKAKVIGAGFHQARGSAGASATKNGNFVYEQSSLVSLSMTARTPDGGSSGYFLRNHFDVAKLDTTRCRSLLTSGSEEDFSSKARIHSQRGAATRAGRASLPRTFNCSTICALT
jgi:predicted Zn-dependent protease